MTNIASITKFTITSMSITTTTLYIYTHKEHIKLKHAQECQFPGATAVAEVQGLEANRHTI